MIASDRGIVAGVRPHSPARWAGLYSTSDHFHGRRWPRLCVRPSISLAEYMPRAVIAYRLLIVDEIGHLPMSREQANLFFQIALDGTGGDPPRTPPDQIAQGGSVLLRRSKQRRVNFQPALTRRRAPSTTLAPCAERSPAVASPSPLIALVMMTTFPSIVVAH
jgi:hypothetical protein